MEKRLPAEDIEDPWGRRRTLGRREFLKTVTQAAAAVAACEGMTLANARAGTPGQSAGTIPTRTLGKSGLKLPILGYGGAALPKAWLNPLSYEDRVALVRYAYERGLRYFDTAGNYFESEAILGEALERPPSRGMSGDEGARAPERKTSGSRLSRH